MKLRSSRRFVSHLRSLVLAIALPSCGSGADVYLGASASASSGGSGGQVDGGGPGVCGAAPCANFHGTRVFIASSANGDTPSLFGAASEASPEQNQNRSPTLVYPSHETMLPLNVHGIRSEWLPAGNTRFELSFIGPNTHVIVYTADTSYVPNEEEWAWIAESNRGGAVKVTVRGLDADGTLAVRSKTITLHFAKSSVDGAIYYWSTSGQGVMRALVSDTTPVKFYPDPTAADAGKCAGCHTLSRDGKRLAVSYDMSSLRVVSLPDRKQLFPLDSGTGGGVMPMEPMKMMMEKAPTVPADWSTFSPDGNSILVAAGGKLTLIELTTGSALAPAQNVQVPPGQVATHPDWSALGDQIVFTLGSKGGARDVEGGAIARATYDDLGFGAPEIIVPNAGGADNNYFPVFSPDSRFVAYVNASGKSEDAASSTIRLVELATRRIIELPRLNQRVNEHDGVMGLGNSMPTFAPATEPGIFWLAFSSIRPYASLRPLDKKQDQIFIAALDVSQTDPSYAAFWAPFQSIEQGNHRAFWTHDSGDVQCRCVDICGDGIDNDCDGTADEADCVATCAPREICDDGIDNDCDCVIDDCAREICDDGVDNDGDGRVDAEDPACSD
jgi:hypothetical protein